MEVSFTTTVTPRNVNGKANEEVARPTGISRCKRKSRWLVGTDHLQRCCRFNATKELPHRPKLTEANSISKQNPRAYKSKGRPS